MDKVSVILTTYNSGYQILEVINSILFQEGINKDFKIELIIVDDCSTDNTIELLKSDNISFIRTNRNSGGPNKGRNIALKQCKGDYICIADHDDVWFPNKISELLKVSEFAPIISSGYTLLDTTTGKRIERVNTESDTYVLYNENNTFISKLTRSNFGQQTYLGSIMFSSSLKHILFEEEYGMIDFDWVLKLFHNKPSIEVCKSLYLRKVEEKNLSLNEKYRINDYNYSLNTIDEFSDKYPSEVRISEKRINGSLARYYYLIGSMSSARKYFIRSEMSFKTILYLITTFAGSKLVKRYFNIFG